MPITLTPEVQGFLEQMVSTGQYSSIDEAANSLLSRQAAADSDIQRLRQLVDVGIDQADRKEFADYSAQDIIRQSCAKLGLDCEECNSPIAN